jgi:endonuclease YncB( thermonuclease family)
MPGTRIEAIVERAVDGDTLRVAIGGQSESIRLLALDTEESIAGGRKPVTPWGRKAAEVAKLTFPPGVAVEIEFPGPEPVAEAIVRYRDNYGRLLAFADTPDGMDFQERITCPLNLLVVQSGMAQAAWKGGERSQEQRVRSGLSRAMRRASWRIGG